MWFRTISLELCVNLMNFPVASWWFQVNSWSSQLKKTNRGALDLKCTALIGHNADFLKNTCVFDILRVNLWELSFWKVNFRQIVNYFLGAYALNNWNLTQIMYFQHVLIILLWSLWLENQQNHKMHQNNQFLSWRYEVVFRPLFLTMELLT